MLSAIFRRIFGAETATMLYRLIVETAWPFRWHYAAALILMAVVSAMYAAIFALTEDFFNDAFISKNPAALQWLAGLVLVIFVVRGLSMYGYTVILARVGNRIVATLQRQLYTHIVQQGMVFHEQNKVGDLSIRITQNCNMARMALQTIAMRLGGDLMTVIGLIAVLLWIDLTMSIVALIGAPIVFGGIAFLMKRVKTLARQEVEMNASILNAVNETVQGARVVKAFNLQGHMRNRAGDAIDGVRQRANQLAVLQALANPLMEVVAGVGAALVLVYAGWRIIDGGIEVGGFIAFLGALLALGDPARRLSQTFVLLRQLMAGVEFIYETLDTDTRPPQPDDAPRLSVSEGAISFQDVHFSYGDVPALNGLNLTAAPGEVTALVGPSGAGKSTVLSLLERFYDPTEGSIAIDGQDVLNVDIGSLRSAMALVTQETFLFDDTIAANIAFGRPDATRAEIEAAAAEANAAEFIEAMPEGYESLVGEGGSQLSGGQRQRVAIARAILRDSPILLLDEATSALDAESEAHVQEALGRLMAGRTTVVIAHRLATIHKAHKIAVLDDGRLVEEGTHDYLVAQDGLYSRLAALQFGRTETAGEQT